VRLSQLFSIAKHGYCLSRASLRAFNYVLFTIA
jgi:hypothetical protein